LNYSPPAEPTEVVRDPSGRRRLLVRAAVLGVVAFVVGFAFTAVVLFGGGGGDEVVTVPDLRGRTEDAARQLLRRAGLEMDVGPALTNPEVPAGQVLAQSPLPGEEVAPNSVVRVTPSSGAEQRPVPEVGSLSGSQARELLTRAGFAVEVEERIDETPAGRVLEVVPRSGTPVNMPGTVRLVVSAGPPRVPVPDVVGMSENAARDRLEQAGFSIDAVDYDPFAFQPTGTVTGQTPWGGSEVRAGSAVRLVVAGGDPGNL
jgi:beta-lactam-binding protein with PASTA domain